MVSSVHAARCATSVLPLALFWAHALIQSHFKGNQSALLFCVWGFSPVTPINTKKLQGWLQGWGCSACSECICPIAEVDSKRSPVISTHHLAFHELIASLKFYRPVFFLFLFPSFLVSVEMRNLLFLSSLMRFAVNSYLFVGSFLLIEGILLIGEHFLCSPS